LLSSNIVNSDESLGRYLPESSYFSASKNSVRPKAFMPPTNLRLSVFRIEGLSLEKVWGIGQKVIEAMPTPKILYGVADIKVAKVRENELEVDADNIPTLGHANIIGWPEDKGKQKLIAQSLAAEANLILK